MEGQNPDRSSVASRLTVREKGLASRFEKRYRLSQIVVCYPSLEYCMDKCDRLTFALV